MTEATKKEFEELCKPLNEFLQREFTPHHRIVIEADIAEIVGGEYCIRFEVVD